MTTRLPNGEASPIPIRVPIVEAWHLKPDAETEIGESILPAPLRTITVDEAREEVVTLEIVGSYGFDSQAYELDLTPSGADELALWLIRRAEEARTEIRTARWKKRQA